MTIRENIYNKSPLFIQNAMVSLYGLKLYYERYMGNYKKYLQELLETQWMSKDEILSYQTDKFLELINHTYKNVPYYKRLFSNLNLHPTDFKSLDDIKKLPILDKETVRMHSDLLIDQSISRNKIIKLNTSGTTGKSLNIYVDLNSRRKEYAFITRSQMWAGLKNGKHNVTFGGRGIIPEKRTSKKFWRYNAIMDSYLFSSYHISDENIPSYIEKLKKVNPMFIDSYPSSVYAIAKFMHDNSMNGISPNAIITTAETLLDNQRDIIEKVFNCSIYDQYGCTEQAIFISQCEKGSYHIHPEYGIVEIINEDGDEVKQGEIGRIVSTGIVNQAMPLIRYDIGDTAVPGSNQCACGRNFPTIEKIYGREDDFILTPDGRRVGRLDPIFKGLTSIKMAQIVQTKLNEIEIKLIPGESYTSNDGGILKKELRKRVGDSININITLVKHIAKTRTGKFRSVISLIKGESEKLE